MKAYRVISRGQHIPTCVVDTQGLFHTTLEEFKKTYGLNRLDQKDQDRYMRGLTNSRLSLSKDKIRLNLSCNPMTDDMAVVFSDWISHKPGFSTVKENELKETTQV